MEGTLFGDDCAKPEPLPNVFLMSIVLFLGTFIVSVILKDFKNSLFFSSKVNSFINRKKKYQSILLNRLVNLSVTSQ